MNRYLAGGQRRPVPWPGQDRALPGGLVVGPPRNLPREAPRAIPSMGRAQAPIRRRLVGLDLGQRNDYSALAVADVNGHHLALRALERTRGRSYVDIALLVRDTMRSLGPAILLVDATGLGAAVCDVLMRLGVAHIRVTLHSGRTVTTLGSASLGVPKRDLVATLVVALETRKLRIARGLPLVDALEAEANAFSVKLSASGHDSYNAREGEHDDLVLAVALCTWYARRLRPPGQPVAGGQRSGPLVAHAERLRAQLARLPNPAKFTASANQAARTARRSPIGWR